MENQELDILILRYINNELKVDEKIAFEKRMSNNEILKKEVDEFLIIKKGINSYGKQNLKEKIIAAEFLALKSKSISNYKPSINGGGGFSFGKFLFKTLFVLGAVSAGLIYFDEMPIQHPIINEINKNMHQFNIQEKFIQTDTFWHIIKTDKLSNGDTVIIKSVEELEEWKKLNNK